MSYPDHLFVTSDGNLYDTRTNTILRRNFEYHHREINTTADLKATLCPHMR